MKLQAEYMRKSFASVKILHVMPGSLMELPQASRCAIPLQFVCRSIEAKHWVPGPRVGWVGSECSTFLPLISRSSLRFWGLWLRYSSKLYRVRLRARGFRIAPPHIASDLNRARPNGVLADYSVHLEGATGGHLPSWA